MNKLKYLVYVIVLIFFLGCDKDDNSSEEPLMENFLFEDGFETQNGFLEELFP